MPAHRVDPADVVERDDRLIEHRQLPAGWTPPAATAGSRAAAQATAEPAAPVVVGRAGPGVVTPVTTVSPSVRPRRDLGEGAGDQPDLDGLRVGMPSAPMTSTE